MLCSKRSHCNEEQEHCTKEQPSLTTTREKPAQQRRLSTAKNKKRKGKGKELRKAWQMDEPLGSSRDYARRTTGTEQRGTVGRTLWVRGPALLITVCVTPMKLLPHSGLVSLAINEKQDHFNSMFLLYLGKWFRLDEDQEMSGKRTTERHFPGSEMPIPDVTGPLPKLSPINFVCDFPNLVE